MMKPVRDIAVDYEAKLNCMSLTFCFPRLSDQMIQRRFVILLKEGLLTCVWYDFNGDRFGEKRAFISELELPPLFRC